MKKIYTKNELHRSVIGKSECRNFLIILFLCAFSKGNWNKETYYRKQLKFYFMINIIQRHMRIMNIGNMHKEFLTKIYINNNSTHMALNYTTTL